MVLVWFLSCFLNLFLLQNLQQHLLTAPALFCGVAKKNNWQYRNQNCIKWKKKNMKRKQFVLFYTHTNTSINMKIIKEQWWYNQQNRKQFEKSKYCWLAIVICEKKYGAMTHEALQNFGFSGMKWCFENSLWILMAPKGAILFISVPNLHLKGVGNWTSMLCHVSESCGDLMPEIIFKH